MKAFLVLSAIVSVAVARPGVLHATPLPSLQTYATASATASSPRQLQLLNNAPLNAELLEDCPWCPPYGGDVEKKLEAVRQRAQANENIRNALGLGILSASTSAQVQSQHGASPLLSATRLAQTLASVSPTGASSSSSFQLLESPELTAARVQQQNLQQHLLQANGLPLLLGTDGQLVASPLLVG